jgi:hypothetical protein
VQDTARFTQSKRDFAFLDGPFFIEEAPVLCLKPFKLSLLLQADFQFGEIQVLCVAEALKKEPIHDLSEGLVTASDTSVSRDIENDGVSWNLLVDQLQQHLQLVITCTQPETIAGGNPSHRSILDRKAEHLCEAGFTGAEETRYPNGNTFVRFIGRLSICVKNIGEVRPNSVGHDILANLVTQDIVGGLVDFDDFLDATMDIVGKKGLDRLRGHSFSRQKIFGR